MILALLFLSSCTKIDLPDIQEEPYGVYNAVSITTAIPIDFSRSGRQTTEHIDDFSYCSEFFSIEWRLNKETPIMDFDYFDFHRWYNEEIMEEETIMGCGVTRRIVHLGKNNSLELSFFGDDGTYYTDPNRIDTYFKIKSLEFFQRQKSIKLVAQQQFYDFVTEEFVETEVTYRFEFGSPAFNY
ncbi:hypothetical protein SAMN04487988_11527 [Algoriphagus hitonicola]|uniref:Uncharacterized protein n=1 Tax=Algoriphagus hitonicola TaxID=435880 RepID=A0A1I2WYV3_9BACT|nr:hypothetical protein SAMN04487988_11527 [Algoriphagus hitonicola]